MPTSLKAWSFLATEGIFISAGWFLQYRLVQSISASNLVLISALNSFATAGLGAVVLGEQISPSLILGGLLIFSSVFLVIRLKSSTDQKFSQIILSSNRKIILILLGIIAFAVGILFEKQAIDLIGVWSYAFYGWLMQFIGSVLILLIFGRKEIKTKTIPKAVIIRGLMLGLLTSVSGALFIYALSVGLLGNTLITSTAKIALTMILAAIIFKEYNNMWLRFLASILVISGTILAIL